MLTDITYFASLYETQGRRVSATWPSIFARLAHPKIHARKEDAAGWSPALFENDSRAESNRALSLGALVVEYDHGVDIDYAAGVWGAHFGFLYTTYSHRADAPRLRIIIVLTRRVSPEEHGRLWRWAESVGGAIDARARDAKRFWFLPAIPPGGLYETHTLTGAPLDPDAVLRNVVDPLPAHEPPRPKPIHRGNVMARASAYLARMPASVAGAGGHDALFRAALALVRGFGLSDAQAVDLLLLEFNPRCQPFWREKDIHHKVSQAIAKGERPWGFIADRRSA